MFRLHKSNNIAWTIGIQHKIILVSVKKKLRINLTRGAFTKEDVTS